jgi:hypothetical protein
MERSKAAIVSCPNVCACFDQHGRDGSLASKRRLDQRSLLTLVTLIDIRAGADELLDFRDVARLHSIVQRSGEHASGRKQKTANH